MSHTLSIARFVQLTAAALVLALLATLAPLVPSAASADSSMERQFIAAVNRERAAQGLPSLSTSGDLTSVARSWSGRMADESKLYHNPSLGSQVSGWKKVGENVGRGPNVDAIHAAFMASPGHRRNILDADWTQIGMGVVVRDGTVWVTQVFRLPAGAAPKAEPEPKAEPATEPAPKAEPATVEPARSTSSDSESSNETAPSTSGSSPQPASDATPTQQPEPPGETRSFRSNYELTESGVPHQWSTSPTFTWRFE